MRNLGVRRSFRVAFCALLLLGLLLSARIAAADTPPKWRVLFYACADRRDSDNAYVQGILQDALSAASSNVEVVAFVDPNNNATMTLCGQSFSHPSFVRSQGAGTCTVQPEPEADVDCTLAQTLKTRLIDRLSSLPTPSQGTLLVIAGHGDGWAGCLFEQAGMLRTMDLPTALGSLHPKVIVFNCCSMGQLEALSNVVESTDYIAAGELELEWSCITYSQVLTWLDANPYAANDDVAKSFGRAYHCTNNCRQCGLRGQVPQIFCVFQASKLKTAIAKCNTVGSTVAGLPSSEQPAVLDWLRSAREAVPSTQFSGEEMASVDVANLFPGDGPSSSTSAVAQAFVQAKQAVADARICRAGNHELRDWAGAALLLRCDDQFNRADYKAFSPLMGGWASLVDAYVLHLCGQALAVSMPEPAVYETRKEVVEISARVDKGAARLVGKVRVSVRGPDGTTLACGVPIAPWQWTATDRPEGPSGGRIDATWDRLVPWLYSAEGRMPVPLEFPSANSLAGDESRDQRLYLSWTDGCTGRSAPVELLLAQDLGTGARAAGFYRALEHSASWPAAVDLTCGRLRWPPSAQTSCESLSSWALDVADARTLELRWEPVDLDGASLALTVENAAGTKASTGWMPVGKR